MRKELIKIVITLGFLIAVSASIYANDDDSSASQNDYHISLMNLDSDEVLISLKAQGNSDYELVIRDESGKVVFQEKNENNTFQFKAKKGFYIVYINHEGNEFQEGVINI